VYLKSIKRACGYEMDIACAICAISIFLHFEISVSSQKVLNYMFSFAEMISRLSSPDVLSSKV